MATISPIQPIAKNDNTLKDMVYDYKTVQKKADEAYKYEAAVLERLEYLRYKKNPTHDERVEYEALKRIKEEAQG